MPYFEFLDDGFFLFGGVPLLLKSSREAYSLRMCFKAVIAVGLGDHLAVVATVFDDLG